MNHRQFLKKMRAEGRVLDARPVAPVARFLMQRLVVEVYQNDVIRLPADAIVCGMLTPVNPLGALFPQYWDAGLAWGHMAACPRELKEPVDDEVIVPLHRPGRTPVRYIGVVHPARRPPREQLRRTIETLGERFGCRRINVLAPTVEAANFLRSIPACDVVAAVQEASSCEALERIGLVDEWDPWPYVEHIAALGAPRLAHDGGA